MAARDRITMFPSRANFVLIKQRMVSAQKGLSLLKRRRDALELHLRQLSAELNINREKLVVLMPEAYFSLAKAKFLRTDFKPTTVMNPDRANAHVCVKYTKIVGIQVPTFELVLRQSHALNLTGLAGGGQQVQIVRQKFQEALKILIEVASLRYSVAAIREAIRQNNTRVNGLEFVVLPRYQNTMAYIRDELDEFEREDFYRLKRSQAKQIKKKLDFLNLMKHREKVPDALDPGVDFTDTHLQTPVHEIIAAKPEVILQERRKTITKIKNKTIVVETQEPEPLNLDVTIPKISSNEKDMDINATKVVTSSSSSSSSEDD